MKRFFQHLLLIFCLLMFILPPVSAAKQTQTSPVLRVLLRRLSLTDRIDLKLNGVYEIQGDNLSLVMPQGANLTVQIREGELYLFYQGMRLSVGRSLHFLRTGSPADYLTIGNASGEYPGDLHLSVEGGLLQPILHINMEDYLLGVVPYEMSNSFPVEALKAQAVCARTYAMGKINPKAAWDLVDTTNDQVFKGIDRTDTNAASAVRQTAGIVGMVKGQLAMCYYSASNGGLTVLPSQVWGGTDPTCYAVTDDPYDLDNPASVVRKANVLKQNPLLPSAIISEIYAQIKTDLLKAGFVADETMFRIDHIDAMELSGIPKGKDSRYATSLTITIRYSGKKPLSSRQVLDNEEDWSLFPTTTPVPTATPAPTEIAPVQYSDYQQAKDPLTVTLPLFPTLVQEWKLSINGANNEIITLKETNQAFLLEARRFGHGVGMSQRGAQWMASQYGATYDQILGFYYPGMQLMQSPTATAPLPTLPPQLAYTPGPPATPTPRPTLMPTSTDHLAEGTWAGEVTGIADNSSLNLRAEPNLASPILMRLYKHQVLIVLETCEDPAWVKVKSDIIEGYVMSEYLTPLE